MSSYKWSLSHLAGPSIPNLLNVPGGIEVKSSGLALAHEVRWARSRRDRSRGLLGSVLNAGEALVIVPAKQVHTFGMVYAIDVVFCDKRWVLRHVVRSMAPRRVTRVVPSAHFVIELPEGTVPREVAPGEVMEVRDQPSSDL